MTGRLASIVVGLSLLACGESRVAVPLDDPPAHPAGMLAGPPKGDPLFLPGDGWVPGRAWAPGVQWLPAGEWLPVGSFTGGRSFYALLASVSEAARDGRSWPITGAICDDCATIPDLLGRWQVAPLKPAEFILLTALPAVQADAAGRDPGVTLVLGG